MAIKNVLFDLDGTMLDTAPDILYAINQVRMEYSLENLSLESLRPKLNHGSKSIVKHAFGVEHTEAEKYNLLREKFLLYYLKHLADATTFFPNMEKVLNFLDQQKIAWGIVTNKLIEHTTPLLTALQFYHRPSCIVCGDTLSTYKPDPAPILHACDLLKAKPNECLFIGDALTDVQAGKAAGTKALVALYGYIDSAENPYEWNADGYIKDPLEIIDWLN